MIFKVKHDEKVRESNPGIDAIEALKDIPDRVLKYVFLMYDYDSPYSRLPESMRKEQVLINIGYTNEGMIKKFASNYKKQIAAAKEVLNNISYNAEMEALISCKRQMSQWDELLRDEEKDDKEKALARQVFDKMPEYMKRIKEMEEIVGYREKYENEEENNLTPLERYMQTKG